MDKCQNGNVYVLPSSFRYVIDTRDCNDDGDDAEYMTGQDPSVQAEIGIITIIINSRNGVVFCSHSSIHSPQRALV